ncbi:MAG: phosphopyruvate hydratase [Oscillospiraceae bacterium]|nr:phosphopyruvate hydratase [Oscillospiraceae bacterium]
MFDAKIACVDAIEILDSRGKPTVKARVITENGKVGEACVPSGASTGSFEAHEKRDGGKRHGGKGVLLAVGGIRERISPALKGMSVFEQAAIDAVMRSLDNSENKSNLGANAILAVSLACARAAANCNDISLYSYLGGEFGRIMPVPMMNILNGGAHAANNIDIQEFMIMPVGAGSFGEAVEWCCEVYNALGCLLKSRGYSRAIGDEGGFAPDLESDEQAIELIITAIRAAGLDTDKVKLALDAAASEWAVSPGKYIAPKRQREYSAEQLCEHWEKLCGNYPIISLEDGIAESDFEGWKQLTCRLGEKIQLVGDDLFVTDPKRIREGIADKRANAVLIKPNQIGSLTETMEAIATTQAGGYCAIISHRSGETEDAFIADLAVAVNAGQIKTGAPCRGERTAKYNRLLEIERELGKRAIYGAKMPFRSFKGGKTVL